MTNKRLWLGYFERPFRPKLGSFAQWRYSNQWSNREVLLLLVENYTQYPAISTWNTVVFGNFCRLFLEQFHQLRTAVHRHPENHERAINLAILPVSGTGEIPRVESNYATGSTSGGALPSLFFKVSALQPYFLWNPNDQLNERVTSVLT